MVLSAPLISVIKYSFLGLVVTGAGFLIANTAVTMSYKSEKMEHLPYKMQSFPRNTSLSLSRNSLLCLTHPNKPFCLMPSKNKLKLLRNRHLSSGRASETIRPFYLLMKDFVDLANDLKVAPMLLEPSILFCMLSTLQKYSVVSHNLQTKILQGSPNMVTFGIFERESRIFTQESSVKRFAELGYEFSTSRERLDQSGEEFVDTSFFFTRQNMTVTVIVFFQRDSFVWHPGSLGSESFLFQLLQSSSSQAYENFTAVPFLLGNGNFSGFHLPSEVNHFLLQVQNSKFEECWPRLTTNEDLLISHPTLSRYQLTQRALIAVQELKSVLRPVLGTFWLWNKTLSGWEDSCDIFQKTSDFYLAIAVPVSADPKMDLNSTFMNNSYLHQVEYRKWDDFQLQLILDCYGLRIRISVFYADLDSMWSYEIDSTGDLIKKTYPNLRLCSASFIGQLIHKPCSQ